MKTLFVSLLLSVFVFGASAQEQVYQVDEISVINYGDGRLLFRQLDDKKSPLNGEHRIIDGYRSECIVATFKDGMYDGAFQYLKNNKLKEEGTYANGRKQGVYKEYFLDGKMVKKETSYTEGKLNGVTKTYYTDGKLESEKGYKMSVEDGVERRYDYQTGKMTVDKNYIDGKLHGKQYIEMSSNVGDFVVRSNYENGVPVGDYSEIYTTGKIKKQGRYNSDGKEDGEWLIDDPFEKNGQKVVYKNGEVVEEKVIRDFEKYQQKK